MPRPVHAAIVAAHEALRPFDIVGKLRDASFGFISGHVRIVLHPHSHYKGLSLTVKLIAIWRKSASISLLHPWRCRPLSLGIRLFP